MLATYFNEVILLKVQAWKCIKNNKVKSSSSLGHLKKKQPTKTKTVCVFAGLIETLHLKLPAT